MVVALCLVHNQDAFGNGRPRFIVANEGLRATVAKRMSGSPDELRHLLLSDAESVTQRMEAASLLAKAACDETTIQTLITVLQTEADARLVMHVMSLFAKYRLPQAVMPLVDLLLCTGQTRLESSIAQFGSCDAGIRIRIAVIQTLGRIGDDRAIVPLMSVLGDQKENYRIRLSAAESLGKLGDSQAVNPLIHIVQDEHEPSQYLKESAVKALGMLGDIRALDPLLDMFQAKRGIKDKFNFLKEQLIEAIGRLGSSNNKAQQTLLEALEDDSPSIRLSAVESLAEVGDADCIEPVLKRLTDTDDDVALAAVSTLYHLGGEALVQRVLDEQENLPQFIREELEAYVP
jgi:HEAT repeat protein